MVIADCTINRGEEVTMKSNKERHHPHIDNMISHMIDWFNHDTWVNPFLKITGSSPKHS